MKAVFWLLVLFAVAIAATLAAKNNGYVLVVAQPYRIELSLNLMALLLSLAFVGYLFICEAGGHDFAIASRSK